jgi:signal transduction histidine kinase
MYFIFIAVILNITVYLIGKYRFNKYSQDMIHEILELVDNNVNQYKDYLENKISSIGNKILNKHKLLVKLLESNEYDLTQDDFYKLKDKLQQLLNIKIDISFIDSKGVIRQTTYKEELGLDLSKIPDALFTMQLVKKKGNIKLDFPIMEINAKYFRAYTLSYSKVLDGYIQIGAILDTTSHFKQVIGSCLNMSKRIKDMKIYCITMYDNDFVVMEFSSLSRISDETLLYNLFNAVKNGIQINEYKQEHLRRYYKRIISKNDILFGGKNVELVYGLTLNLKKEANYNDIYAVLSILLFFIILLLGFSAFLVFNKVFAKPLKYIVARIKESKPVDEKIINQSCRELYFIGKSFNKHLDEIPYKFFSRELLKAQEKERHRIARDLHDGVANDIFYSITLLESLKRKCDCIDYKDTDKIIQQLQNSNESIRSIIYNLGGAELDIIGLKLSIYSFVKGFMEKYGINIEFSFAGNEWDDLPFDYKINIYRIIQEAFRNVAKHSKAKNINLKMLYVSPDYIIKIKDDGIGFDLKSIENSKNRSFGLMSMKQRVDLLGGKFNIITSIGKGTKIVITFTFKDKPDEE